MTFIPYIAAVIILSIIGYFIHAIFKAGKTDQLEDSESHALEVQKKQNEADSRPPLDPAAIINELQDGGL